MVAAFCLVAVPGVRATAWVGLGVVGLVVAAIAQVTVEGRRWQLVPAYAWVVVFAVLWLFGVGTSGAARVAPQAFAVLLWVGGVALVVSVVLPWAVPVFRLPAPGGPFGIGTVTYHWVDTGRPDVLSGSPTGPRELMVQVWYPAAGGSGGVRAPYLQEAGVVAPALARVAGLPRFFFGHLRYVRTHAVPDAEVAAERERYPVLVFLSGRSGFRASNMVQVEALVSRGYVVVGLDQPGAAAAVAFPDGRGVEGLPNEVLQPLVRQSVAPLPVTPTLAGRAMPEGVVPFLAEDVAFVLDRLEELDARDPRGVLTGRLDRERVGVFGVSLGGSVAAQACLKDSRLGACLAMDASMPAELVESGLRQPVMFLTRGAETMRLERRRVGGWPEDAIASTLGSMRAAYEALAGDGYYVQMPGVFHLGFTDAPYWIPLASRLGLMGAVDPVVALGRINSYAEAFFDRHLMGRSEGRLEEFVPARSDEVFEARLPGS